MSKQQSPLWPGAALALASAALFGAAAPFSKLLLADISPVMLAGLLYLGAGAGLALYSFVRSATSGNAGEARLKKPDLPWLMGSITMGGIAGPLLLMLGLSLTSASNAALLLNVEGLATMAIAWVVFRENVDGRLLTGAAAIVAGAVLLSWQGNGLSIDIGALLVVAACIAWGIDNNLTRKISAADPVTIAMSKGVVAGIVNVGVALAYGSSFPAPVFAGAAAALGFFTIGVSLVMFILALRNLGTARTGAYYSLAPFIGATLAIFMLGEPLTAKLLAAGALMGIGLWFHLSERHAHSHVHDVLEHEHSHVHDEHHKHAHAGSVSEPHSHWHRHEPMRHLHVHYPDLHHRHRH